MSLNTVPTDYHEFEYSKLSVFKLKFMNTGRIHAERWSEAEDTFTSGSDRPLATAATAEVEMHPHN